MSISGFPEQIRVVLGTMFQGGGNNLNVGTEIILKQIGATNEWSEDGTTTANPATNRMRIFFGVIGGSGDFAFNMRLAYTGGGWFTTGSGTTISSSTMFKQIMGQGTSGSTYNFLDMWNSDAGVSWVYGSAFPSLSTTSGSGNMKTVLFSVMEQHDPTPPLHGPDKTPYHYG